MNWSIIQIKFASREQGRKEITEWQPSSAALKMSTDGRTSSRSSIGMALLADLHGPTPQRRVCTAFDRVTAAETLKISQGKHGYPASRTALHHGYPRENSGNFR